MHQALSLWLHLNIDSWVNPHGRREWQSTPVNLPWEPHELYKKMNRYETKRWVPQVSLHSLGSIQLAFAVPHFVLQGQSYLLPQVSLDFPLLHSNPQRWIEHLSYVLVLGGLLGLHRTDQGVPSATEEEQRRSINSPRKNEVAGPQQKWCSVADCLVMKVKSDSA